MRSLKSISRLLTRSKLEALMQHKYKDGWYFDGLSRVPFKFWIDPNEDFCEINKTHYSIDMHFAENDLMPTFRMYICNGDGFLNCNGSGDLHKNYKLGTWYIYTDLANVLIGYIFESKYKISLPNRKSLSSTALWDRVNDKNKDIVLAYARNTRTNKNDELGHFICDYVLYYSGFTKLNTLYTKKLVDEFYILNINTTNNSLYAEQYTVNDLGREFDVGVLVDLYLAREFYSEGNDNWKERKWIVTDHGKEFTKRYILKQRQEDSGILQRLKGNRFTDADAAENLKKLGDTSMLVNSKGEAYASGKTKLPEYKENFKNLLEYRKSSDYWDSIDEEVDLSKLN